MTNSTHVDRLSITVPSDLRYGEATRSLLDTLSRRLEHETSTAELTTHVISAFNEAFNNIVEHAYSGSRIGMVDIEVLLKSEGLVISLRDHGKGFVLEEVDEPDLEALPEGGLGLLIIRSFMSNVEYERVGEMNILKMTKEFTKPLSFADDSLQEV